MITNNGIKLLADALSARPDFNVCAGEVDRLNEDVHHPSCLSVIELHSCVGRTSFSTQGPAAKTIILLSLGYKSTNVRYCILALCLPKVDLVVLG